MTAGALQAPQGVSELADSSATGLVAEGWGHGAAVRDRSFWIALAVATLLHGSLFLGLLGHKPRPVGDESGRDDGISISVVTEADIRSESSVSEPPPGPPGPPVQAAPPAPPPPPPLPEAKPAEPLPPEPTPPEPEPAEPPKAEAPPTPQPAPPELKPSLDVAKEISEDVPDLLALPGEGAAPAKKETPKSEKAQEPKAETAPPKPPQKQAKPQPQKKTAALDLSTPPSAFSGAAGGAGRSAGFERPPGITKSGANDAFARAVIRALQGTMPQLRNTQGRVTVRIILNENGNVQSVQVVRPSTAASLDQSVVFATKQTSYPFPPPNSNLADRTFLVTYIYR